MKNICTAFAEPQSVQGPEWQAYWRDQGKMLKEVSASHPEAAYNDGC